MINSIVYICQLSQDKQQKLKNKLSKQLHKEGYKGKEFKQFLADTMNSKLSDLNI